MLLEKSGPTSISIHIQIDVCFSLNTYSIGVCQDGLFGGGSGGKPYVSSYVRQSSQPAVFRSRWFWRHCCRSAKCFASWVFRTRSLCACSRTSQPFCLWIIHFVNALFAFASIRNHDFWCEASEWFVEKYNSFARVILFFSFFLSAVVSFLWLSVRCCWVWRVCNT